MKFSEKYPNLAWWINAGESLVLSKGEYGNPRLTLNDASGKVWDSGKIKDIEEAFDAAEQWIEENVE